jgi:phospholipase/carboxylesterase
MHQKKIITAGLPLSVENKVLIMLHGRGAGAQDILSLSNFLNVKDYTLIAPEATNNSWYPYSFLMPPAQNEPWLSSALSLIKEIVNDLYNAGIVPGNIFFTGFSQGACLTLEYVGRNAVKYGGVAAFTGGLIGDKINAGNYSGDFAGTPIFIGTSDPDPHVPVERVKETSKILTGMHARVTERIYPGMGHTINQDEIENANRLVFT